MSLYAIWHYLCCLCWWYYFTGLKEEELENEIISPWIKTNKVSHSFQPQNEGEVGNFLSVRIEKGVQITYTSWPHGKRWLKQVAWGIDIEAVFERIDTQIELSAYQRALPVDTNTRFQFSAVKRESWQNNVCGSNIQFTSGSGMFSQYTRLWYWS